MKKIADILQALIILYAAWWIFLYYTGRICYTGDQEKRRLERVRKYGWFLIVAIVFLCFSGIALILITIGL